MPQCRESLAEGGPNITRGCAHIMQARQIITQIGRCKGAHPMCATMRSDATPGHGTSPVRHHHNRGANPGKDRLAETDAMRATRRCLASSHCEIVYQ